ncbi:Delta-9 acyl-phospholipid desaturase [Aliidiomarina maris]|uniref:Delta-9 acyl-phospholipid desaturase n=2 Tax=Aliidiomarina maris TaxID=531312 RepID=A0A327X061_9GAMM|nr:Delta-9 acyl-phospholipid desaturase [Aliidiomarina maris]
MQANMQTNTQASAPKKAPLIWLNVLVFSITFAVAAIGVPLYALTIGISAGVWWAALGLFIYSGLSITAGYHRLWSHRTYDAHWTVRLIFALGGALALQNSALHWSSDHREHHKHVDHDDNDPYSASRGFWYSHIGWMLREYQPDKYYDYNNVKDMQRDKIVMWQHKHYLALTLLMNIGVPILIGVLTGQIIASLLVAGFLRLVVNHHTTFFINSLAHIWGKRPFTERNSARDNGVLAFFTFGEGYHNFHHIFSGDYRNGIRWYQYDPTKWLIRGMSYVGLANNLKRASDYQIEKARMDVMWSRLQERRQTTAEWMQHEYDALMEKTKAYYMSRKKLLDAKTQEIKDQVSHSALVEQYRDMKRSFRVERRRWKRMVRAAL